MGLQDSLCPGAKVLMLLALSPAPASVKESINTLNFGLRMRSVEFGTAQVRITTINSCQSDFARHVLPSLKTHVLIV
jgi:hypothetical protein